MVRQTVPELQICGAVLVVANSEGTPRKQQGTVGFRGFSNSGPLKWQRSRFGFP